MIEARLLRVVFTTFAGTRTNERSNRRDLLALPDAIKLGCRIRSAILSHNAESYHGKSGFFYALAMMRHGFSFGKGVKGYEKKTISLYLDYSLDADFTWHLYNRCACK